MPLVPPARSRSRPCGLSPGHYVAYYLYNDGYSRVASPLKFRIVPSTAATTLKVASFNTWMAAYQVTDGPTKATNFITSSGADVVALQETGGTLAKDLARDLGWYYYQGPASAAIISRYAITQTFGLALDNAGLGARLNLGAGKQAVVWSVHLAAYPYGPYNACYEGMTPATDRGQRTEHFPAGCADQRHPHQGGTRDQRRQERRAAGVPGR